MRHSLSSDEEPAYRTYDSVHPLSLDVRGLTSSPNFQSDSPEWRETIKLRPIFTDISFLRQQHLRMLVMDKDTYTLVCHLFLYV